MLWMLLAFGLGCEATTTVPEFKDRIQEACEWPDAARYVRYFKVEGDHELLTVTIAWRQSLSGHTIAGTPLAHEARRTAKAVWQSMRGYYPMRTFRYRMLEGDDVEFCSFEWVEPVRRESGPPENPQELPTVAKCLTYVP